MSKSVDILSITDMLGRVVITARNTNSINLQILQAGVYRIRYSYQGKEYIDSLVKQ